MDRLQFLEKACQLAHEQIEASSCLTDKEFAEILETDDSLEIALYKKAKEILEDAVFEMDIKD